MVDRFCLVLFTWSNCYFKEGGKCKRWVSDALLPSLEICSIHSVKMLTQIKVIVQANGEILVQSSIHLVFIRVSTYAQNILLSVDLNLQQDVLSHMQTH